MSGFPLHVLLTWHVRIISPLNLENLSLHLYVTLWPYASPVADMLALTPASDSPHCTTENNLRIVKVKTMCKHIFSKYLEHVYLD